MNNQNISDLVDLYILRCEIEGKSPTTVIAYRWTLGRFLAVLSEDVAPIDPRLITREHLYQYLGCFIDRAADTRHRYYREVRCFFNWLVDSAYLERSPFQGMKNIRVPQRIVRPFTASDVTRLLDTCGVDAIGIRDRAMIMTRICQNSVLNLDFYHRVGKKRRPVEYEIEHQPDLLEHRIASER